MVLRCRSKGWGAEPDMFYLLLSNGILEAQRANSNFITGLSASSEPLFHARHSTEVCEPKELKEKFLDLSELWCGRMIDLSIMRSAG